MGIVWHMDGGRDGGLLYCRVRYFDAQARRPGLPTDVGALVETLEVTRAVLRLVNLHGTQARTVIVQAGGFGEQTHEYIGAVVAGCALEQNNLAEWFDRYSESAYLVGVRSTPAGAAEQWLENLATVRGLDALATRGLRLDLLVGYEAFEGVGRLAAAYPELGIMLNHCGNPPIREEGFAAWSAALAPLVHYPNILVKYSSPLLYTYSDAHADRVRPYTDFLLEQFGPERLA